MKSCPQCQTKCLNSAGRCECGYAFLEVPAVAARAAVVQQAVADAAGQGDSGDGGMWNRAHPTTADGLVKLDADTPLEAFFTSAGCLMASLSLAALWVGLFGGRSMPPQPAVLPYLPFLLLAALVLFAARWCTENYYLVDPKKHRVFYHFKFLWFRRTRLLLEHQDVLAVATQGHIRQMTGRFEDKWAYRVLVVGAGGQRAGVTSWRPGDDGLAESNAEGVRIARLLDCPVLNTPRHCEIRIRIEERAVPVTFTSGEFGSRTEITILLTLALLLIVGFLLLAWYSHHV